MKGKRKDWCTDACIKCEYCEVTYGLKPKLWCVYKGTLGNMPCVKITTYVEKIEDE